MIDNATADHERWLDAVYSDRSLPTELTGVPRHDGHGMHPMVTSSTTMPGLVFAMLEALDLPDTAERTTVLEIGTATGYNAALLCHRLGDRNVTTIDISPELAALARVRLAATTPTWFPVTAPRASPTAARSTGSSPPAGLITSHRRGSSRRRPAG